VISAKTAFSMKRAVCATKTMIVNVLLMSEFREWEVNQLVNCGVAHAEDAWDYQATEIERLNSQAEKLNRSRDKLKARLTKADTLIEYLTNGGQLMSDVIDALTAKLVSGLYGSDDVSEAAHLLHNQQAEIERLKASTWISVEDEMPNDNQKVLYYFEHTGVAAGKYWGDHYFGGPFGFLHYDVTHWQPWPEPPKGETMIC
jgi:uncharacterized small protein (DUF1192 family)